ncbi:lysosomal acid phosphatase-like isoform X2 [Topomyia yanbarensis]|uniref:lysosomal acid phosphatase-like isoform X2 n=1 Tax=Topomyia yanbarensis TaxID=2498891 RepID=UPI00273CB0C7|nr:lysosomal acid phosphatase-like isoform X2 [Topomyia yanbarensis]
MGRRTGSFTIGFEQLYVLGTNMRKRYKHFIPRRVSKIKQSVYAVSSCTDRCIDSAQSFLAGFLKTSNSSTIRQQPVPLHVILPDQDTFLLQNKTCPKAKQIWKQLEFELDSEFNLWFQEGAALQNLVAEQIGAPVTTLRRLALICDALDVYDSFGLEQPGWASKVFPKRTQAFMLGFLLSYTGNEELKRIRGGAILKEFLNKMTTVRDGKIRIKRKMFFYSGHDLTQVSLFNSIGLIELVSRRPECGSAVVFELHRSKMFWKDLEVRMLYYENAYVTNPMKLVIPNCPDPCQLTKFEQSIEHLLLDDFDKACLL